MPYLDRKAVKALFVEVHCLYLNKDVTHEKFLNDMTDTEFENIWAVVDEDESGCVESNEMIRILLAYEGWRY